MWVVMKTPRRASHPFYGRLNQILDEHDFDGYVEGLCQRFYAEDVGRPGLPPGRYFRLLLIGYFEGLNAERAIAWRAADSFALRDFLGLVLSEAPPAKPYVYGTAFPILPGVLVTAAHVVKAATADGELGVAMYGAAGMHVSGRAVDGYDLAEPLDLALLYVPSLERTAAANVIFRTRFASCRQCYRISVRRRCGMDQHRSAKFSGTRDHAQRTASSGTIATARVRAFISGPSGNVRCTSPGSTRRWVDLQRLDCSADSARRRRRERHGGRTGGVCHHSAGANKLTAWCARASLQTRRSARSASHAGAAARRR